MQGLQSHSMGFPGSPGLRICAPTAGGVASIPGEGTKIPEPRGAFRKEERKKPTPAAQGEGFPTLEPRGLWYRVLASRQRTRSKVGVGIRDRLPPSEGQRRALQRPRRDELEGHGAHHKAPWAQRAQEKLARERVTRTLSDSIPARPPHPSRSINAANLSFTVLWLRFYSACESV